MRLKKVWSHDWKGMMSQAWNSGLLIPDSPVLLPHHGNAAWLEEERPRWWGVGGCPWIFMRGLRDERKRSWEAGDIGEDQAIGLWCDQEEEGRQEAAEIGTHQASVQLILPTSDSAFHCASPCVRMCASNSPSSSLPDFPSAVSPALFPGDTSQPTARNLSSRSKRGALNTELWQGEADAGPGGQSPMGNMFQCPEMPMFADMLSVLRAVQMEQSSIPASGGGVGSGGCLSLASPQWRACSPHSLGGPSFSTNEFSHGS